MVKFYVLRSKHTDKVYVGQTVDTIKRRFSNHKSDYKRFVNGISTKYNMSCELFKLGLADVKYEILEESNCEDKNLNFIRERYWIESFGDKYINKMIPTRTGAEWCKDNPEKCILKSKRYREKNNEKVKERARELYAINIDKERAKLKIKNAKRALKKKQNKATSLVEAAG